MITISKIQPEGTDYLFKHSNQEYFSESDNEIGRFGGTLSKFKKIDGQIATKEKFDKEMSYCKDFKGVEIDPSPCKDFSVLYNRVNPQEREQLKALWQKSMQAVAKTIEQNTYYRETKDGKTDYKLAKGVSYAIFDHHTARPVNGEVDFQIHSHIVFFPKVLGKDNKFHSHTLMDLKYEKNSHETLRLFDSVMNYHLAKGLSEMGYAISPSKDGFKIDCINEDVKNNFSKRANQIDEIAGKDSSYADKKKVSLLVRENKSENNINKLREGWQSKMDSMGFTQSKLFKSQKNIVDKSLSDISKEKDKYVFSNKELKTLAYQSAMFSNKTMEQKLLEFREDKKLVYFTNKQAIYKSNNSMTRLATKLKTYSMSKSLAKKPHFSGEKAKPSKPNLSATPSPTASPSQSIQPKASMFQQASSRGESVQECMSEIKQIEQQLSSMKLDDPNRANLESRIGELKNKAKQIESQSKSTLNASASVANEQQNSSQFKNNSEEIAPMEQFYKEIDSEKQHLAHSNLNDSARKIIKDDIEMKMKTYENMKSMKQEKQVTI